MKRDTRQEIIEAAARLIHRQGYTSTGVKEIVDAAGVPKGSFYFYFPSKEALGLALIEHYGVLFRENVEPIMRTPGMSPLRRLRLFFESRRDWVASNGCSLGCPIGGLAQEMSSLSEPMREHLEQALHRLSAAVQHLLEQAVADGELKTDIPTETLAAFLIDAWEGALLRMKAECSAQALDRFISITFASLLPGAPN